MWWAYLLYEKNETAYKEKIELNRIAFQKDTPRQDYATTDDYLKLHSKYLRQKFMIVGEGSVFMLLLLLGLLRVRKVFLREMELADQQRNFLHSITHELKSPLSTIKLSLQTLAMRKLEIDKSDKLIANSLVDLDRLETLVDNILIAAKIERDDTGFSNDEINLSEITRAAVERFAHNKKEIGIKTQIEPNVLLGADAIGYTSVINNLIENGIKYSEPQTRMTVTLKNDDGAAILIVSDEGTGIPDNEKLRVFEKFYRIGNGNTRKTKGAGLGLYIVKRFVEIYGGKIAIEDNTPGGSIFKLILPRKANSA